jgi:hypothetical protein
MHLWLSRDGYIRGVIALRSITEDEFLTALGARWPMTLRPIRLNALYDELYAVVRPDVMLADDPSHARYQPRQVTVRPSRPRGVSRHTADALAPDPFGDPMPVLIA